MPSALSLPEIERIKFHLGYSDAAPTGDSALLEQRCQNLSSIFYRQQVELQLARCDRTWQETETDQQSDGIAYRRNIIGDVNRSDIEYRPEPLEKRWKTYFREINQLAITLGVINYRDPSNFGYLNRGVIKQ